MKPGKEYEAFVYSKFKNLFQNFEVIQNDRIIGKQSNIRREIDISIKGKVDGVNLLYLVQCKDHKKPADVKIIGEFSSVLKDIGASKGFLICSSGFTKSIHQYSQTLGIELITVEDINSEKWKIDIQIPIVYIRRSAKAIVEIQFVANKELAEKNKAELQITKKDLEIISFDGGKTEFNLLDLLNKKIESDRIDISITKQLFINEPNQLLKLSGIWVPAKFEIQFIIHEMYFLKFIRPHEYSQIMNHVNKEVLPLKIEIREFKSQLDESFIEVSKEDLPIESNVSIEVVENLTPFKELQYIGINSVSTVE